MADLGATSIFPVRVLTYTGNLKVGTPVATLPGASRFRVSLGLVSLVSVGG